MKRTIMLAVVLALLAVVALGTVAAVALAQGPFGGGWMGGGMMGRGGMMGGYGYGVTPGQTISPAVPYGGMMRGRGMMSGYGVAPGQTISPTLPYGNCPMAGGYGVTPGQTISPTTPYGGMMGGWYNSAPNAKPITLDEAVQRAQNFVTAYNNADLKLVEVEEYAYNFYGVVQEKSTGINAFQILIDKYNGGVYPEMGPNMMWNTKYSPMSQMMGGYGFQAPTGKLTVTVEQARANAQDFLQKNLPGTALEDATDTFYGYYNLDVLKDGKTYGMLSVNGYTGAVWYHTWHGDFVQAKELQ